MEEISLVSSDELGYITLSYKYIYDNYITFDYKIFNKGFGGIGTICFDIVSFKKEYSSIDNLNNITIVDYDSQYGIKIILDKDIYKVVADTGDLEGLNYAKIFFISNKEDVKRFIAKIVYYST